MYIQIVFCRQICGGCTDDYSNQTEYFIGNKTFWGNLQDLYNLNGNIYNYIHVIVM